MTEAVAAGHPPPEPTVVLLAGAGDATDIVANHLAAAVPNLVVIVEDAPSRVALARRRAARVGWVKALGQVLFVVVALPVLRRKGQARVKAILARNGLDAFAHPADHSVSSVNGPELPGLLDGIGPAVVVVNGTRIISRRVLDTIGCPVINTHAGITPRYRGVHGGYWALAEGRPDLVGTTIHLVDPGIDTGEVLARAYFDTGPEDTIATYPYLHLAAGLGPLTSEVQRILEGGAPIPLAEEVPEGGSRLYLHPTLGQYLRRWLADGVR